MIMKTKINQIVTIVGFFTTTIAATLFVSWGMSIVVFCSTQAKNNNGNIIEQQIQVQIKERLPSSFKLLIPKI